MWQWLVWQLKQERVFQCLFLLAFIALCAFVYFTADGEAPPRDCDPPDDSGYGWCYEPEPEPRPYD